MAKRYKCPYCDDRYERDKLIDHIEDDHEDLIPEKETVTQVVFNSINKKTHGTCIVCKSNTKWNEKAGKYDRLCSNPKCREKLRQEFKTNAMNKRGTYNFASDPKFQEKMLKGRKISSVYTFTDGGKVDYVGSYEKKFLEFVDKVMDINSKDIMGPGPTIEYIYNGQKHYWITDFYYVPANLVLDIKDGGKNPNNRPMEEYREKQTAKELYIKKLKKYNYLRLTDNNFGQFIEVLSDMKSMALDMKQKQLINKINEGVNINELSAGMMTVPPVNSSDASVLISVDNITKEEKIALSSLDFNDSLLIDDEVEGIKKISKKEFKENYSIKEQLLYKKNETYYNLLESFLNKDACIYEGIYHNLTSFDLVLSESQIYYDSSFRYALTEYNDIISLNEKLKNINNCIFNIDEYTLIRNDKLNLSDNIEYNNINISDIKNGLTVELESYTDGYYLITPSKDKDKLDKSFQLYNSQNSDQKIKSDTRSFSLYGMNNYDHYHILLSKIKKGTKDDELNGLEYDPYDETIVREDYAIYKLSRDFNCNSISELDEKILMVKDFNMHTLGRAIVYPTQDANELESLFMKYMALGLDERSSSDNKAVEIFGMSNREIYSFIIDNVIKPVQDDIENTLSVEDETIDKSVDNTSSITTNDLPVVTPEEVKNIDEDYSSFNIDDAKIIKSWRESYISMNENNYRQLNIQRLNILRKSIYEDNTDAIIQCGWIPGLEFNSGNRVKVSNTTKEKINNMITEAKSLPIQFDKDGNLIIKNIKKIDYEQEYTNSHRLLMQYDKNNSYDPMKFELSKMQFFITLLEKKIHKQGQSKSKDELKVRARFLNDFKKYLDIIIYNDKSFNFAEYYEQSPFNDALIQIDKSTLKYGWKALKYIIK